jgi:hypothetical protein
VVPHTRIVCLAVFVVALAPGYTGSAGSLPSARLSPGSPRAPKTAPGVTVPGGAVALAQAAGLSRPPDRSLLMLEVIRGLYHVSLDGPSAEIVAARARIGALFEKSGAADAARDVVPLPLGPVAWTRDILRTELADAALVRAILENRRAALFYYGTAALDGPTRTWLASDAARLTRVYERHAELWSVFARSLHIEGGRLRLPGGPAADPIWQVLVEESPDSPEAFIDKLFERHDGRLAWFFDVVSHLPAPMQRHILGSGGDTVVARAARVRAMADVFVKVAVGWRVRENPLWRPLVDPTLLLSELAVDAEGRLAEPRDREFWRALFASDGLPEAPDERDIASARTRRAGPPPGPDADAAFLLARVFLDHPPSQRDRLEQVLFAQRMARITGAAPNTRGDVDLLTIGRGFGRFRALTLSFERMGIREAPVMAAALRRAQRLTARESAEDFATFQSLVACLEQIRLRRSIDAERASALIAALSAQPFGEDRPAWELAAAFLSETLLPEAASAGESDEARLLSAMAGVLAARSPARSQAAAITWEGQDYLVDAAAAERDRLSAVRAAQGTASLDEALALARTITTLRQPGADAFTGASASIDALASRMNGPARRADAAGADETSSRALERARELTARHVAPSNATPWSDAIRSSDAKRGSRDAVRASRLLEPVASRLFAEVLTAIVYAAHLPADRSEFINGRADARHDFGVTAPAAERARLPWTLAEPQAGSGAWRLRGSLLSLDLAFGQFLLRRISDEAPAPTLNGSDRQAFLRNVALVNASDLFDEDRDRLVTHVAQGHSRLATLAASVEGAREIAARAGLSEWREHALAWAIAHDPQAVASALSLAELFWLGNGDAAPGADTQRLDAWGASLVGVTGQWSTRLPRPRAWEDVTGHSGSGLLASQVVDLNIRTAQWLAETRLPAALARGMLSVAMLEFVDTVPVAHPDDWSALVHYVRTLPASRFEDYMAALTVDGPLRPAVAGGEMP